VELPLEGFAKFVQQWLRRNDDVLADAVFEKVASGAARDEGGDQHLRVRKRSGAVGRLMRHHSSISRICASASGVVRTDRLTDGGAVRPELRKLPGADPPQRTSMRRTVRRGVRDAPPRSGHRLRHQRPGRPPSHRATSSARQERAAPSRHARGRDSCRFCTAFPPARQASRGAPKPVDLFKPNALTQTPRDSTRLKAGNIRSRREDGIRATGRRADPCVSPRSSASRHLRRRRDAAFRGRQVQTSSVHATCGACCVTYAPLRVRLA
jgi:hypothetical protein